jgi:glycyl-tRNA synthetase (class II)
VIEPTFGVDQLLAILSTIPRKSSSRPGSSQTVLTKTDLAPVSSRALLMKRRFARKAHEVLQLVRLLEL